MLGRLAFGGLRRAVSARPALTSSVRRKLGLAAGVAGFAGAAVGLASPVRADGSWRNNAPIVVTISGAAGQIAYSEPRPSALRSRHLA